MSGLSALDGFRIGLLAGAFLAIFLLDDTCRDAGCEMRDGVCEVTP